LKIARWIFHDRDFEFWHEIIVIIISKYKMLNLEKFTALKSMNPSPQEHLAIG
jgi:hypothetical protein